MGHFEGSMRHVWDRNASKQHLGNLWEYFFITGINLKKIDVFQLFFAIFRWFFMVLGDFGAMPGRDFSLWGARVYFLKSDPKIVLGPTSRGSISELRRSWKENWVSRIAYSTSTFA